VIWQEVDQDLFNLLYRNIRENHFTYSFFIRDSRLEFQFCLENIKYI